MKPRVTPTEEQTKDLEERLKSFYKNGIMPAHSAFKSFKKIISSAERLANPTLCVNLTNLKDARIDDACETLVSNGTHGFNNMALERHNYIECENLKALKSETKERMECSFVFIIDPSVIDSLSRNTIKRTKKVDNYITEYMLDHIIVEKHIIAALVPEGLESHFSTIFPKITLFTAPLVQGDLSLPVFTRATALCSKNNESTIKEIVIPDYKAALKDYIKANPNVKKIMTHLSRFATRHDLSHPFKELTEQQNEKQLQKMQSKMTSLMFSNVSITNMNCCTFRPSSNEIKSSESKNEMKYNDHRFFSVKNDQHLDYIKSLQHVIKSDYIQLCDDSLKNESTKVGLSQSWLSILSTDALKELANGATDSEGNTRAGTGIPYESLLQAIKK